MMAAARANFRYKKRNPGSGGVKKTSKQATVPGTSSSHLDVPQPLRKRSGSVPSIKIDTLAAVWNLKYVQVRALKMTWSRLCEPPRSNCRGIVSLTERVWEKLDSKDKDVRNIFYNAAFVGSMNERCERRRSGSMATLRDHTHFFVSLISQVVMSLEIDSQHILNHLDEIGRNHSYLKKYGFKSSHWEKVGEYFVDIVVIQDCVRGFPEATRAWTILVSSVVDRLRAAPRRISHYASHISLTNLNDSRRNSDCSLRADSIATPPMDTNEIMENMHPIGCPVTKLKVSERKSGERRGSLILPATTVAKPHDEPVKKFPMDRIKKETKYIRRSSLALPITSAKEGTSKKTTEVLHRSFDVKDNEPRRFSLGLSIPFLKREKLEKVKSSLAEDPTKSLSHSLEHLKIDKGKEIRA